VAGDVRVAGDLVEAEVVAVGDGRDEHSGVPAASRVAGSTGTRMNTFCAVDV
jgi:hypothetical protein